MPVMRRQFTLVLLLGAVGAGLVVLAVRQAWAQAIFTAPKPLPVQDFSVTGQELVPLAGALALAALACLAAVIATRSWLRRACGVLLAVLGAGTAAAVTAGVRASAVLSAAKASASSGALGGSTTSGASPGNATHPIVIAGSAGHAIIAGAPWRALAVIGAVAIILAGLATVWQGPRWPVMSARFDRPGQQAGTGQPGGQPAERADSATMWESLSRDIDPTAEADASQRAEAEVAVEVGAGQRTESGTGPKAESGPRAAADQLDGGGRT
jgi:uncharacterized membrane protein (TIGR02234 family)